MIKTAAELAAACKNVVNNYNTLYVMGCYGAPLTGMNIDRYCNNHAYNRQPERKKMIKAVADKNPPFYGFDCVCLIKGLLWGWNGNPAKTYGGALYAVNGVPDIGADAMINACYDVSNNFTKIEVGEVVWMDGHIGVYIGEGLCIECSPKWANGVQITAVFNIREKPGYNGRYWTKHGKLPYVDYTGENVDNAAPPTKSLDELAAEVIAGKWGNGSARRKKLTAAGYDAAAVQSRVNAMVKGNAAPPTKSLDELAAEVIAGKWGNGSARRKKLAAAGYDAAAVQSRVNAILNK